MNHFFISSGSVLGSPAGFNRCRVLDELFCCGDLFVTNSKVRDHGEGIAGKIRRQSRLTGASFFTGDVIISFFSFLTSIELGINDGIFPARYLLL